MHSQASYNVFKYFSSFQGTLFDNGPRACVKDGGELGATMAALPPSPFACSVISVGGNGGVCSESWKALTFEMCSWTTVLALLNFIVFSSIATKLSPAIDRAIVDASRGMLVVWRRG